MKLSFSKITKLFQFIQYYVFAKTQFGDTVFCIFCGWQGKYFIPGTLVCPNCGSLPRTRLIPYSIMHFNIDLNCKPILHIGPNITEATHILRKYSPSPYYRLDLVPGNMINLNGDACSIPLSSESVDCIIAWHVLEHIPDDRKAIKEMFRVLKPGGAIVISVPIWHPDRTSTFEDPDTPRERFQEVYGHFDHVRACGLDYKERFVEAGFKIETLQVKDVGAQDIAFWGLSNHHVVWH